MDARDTVGAAEGVYAPQHDSHLLVNVLARTGLASGHRVADLCTGSGVVAISAARQGATTVTGFDICPRAVRCARANALAAGVEVEVHLGSWTRAVEFRPFDVVACNPPYVPESSNGDSEAIPTRAGPAWAWNAGPDGRLVLDPLCGAAPDLLADGGTLLLVQSEFAGIAQTLKSLQAVGMPAKVVAQQWIPFGPVLRARAKWLELTGRLQAGRRMEKLVVIRADKP